MTVAASAMVHSKTLGRRPLSHQAVDFPGFCGERLAHFLGFSLEGDGALEAER